MLHDLIPQFGKEVATLHDLAPSGFIMGFNLTYKGPEHLHNAYPERWREIYQDRNYFFSDPIARWTIEEEGWVRWSAVKKSTFDMPFMHAAKQFGLNYGVAISRKTDLKRSFLTLAHPSKEFTDEQIIKVVTKFNNWTDLVLNRASLTAGELDVLTGLRDGLGQRAVAEKLGIAEATVTQRAQKACSKLGAKSRTQAVAIAVARNYI
jgi:LuxR family transcriptional regulator